MEKFQYSSWAVMFKIHARAYQVFNHITPPNSPTPPSSYENELWSRLDPIILQWIYVTISSDLLQPDSIVQQGWDHLKDIFQDSRNSSAFHLENQFTNINM